jgi:fused signal recognition particle receptor
MSGVNTTLKIIDKISERVARDRFLGVDELNLILREEIISLLQENESGFLRGFEIPDIQETPYVIMVVGVNGVGKTTTIGKLAHRFKTAGKKGGTRSCRYVSCRSYRSVRYLGSENRS